MRADGRIVEYSSQRVFRLVKLVWITAVMTACAGLQFPAEPSVMPSPNRPASTPTVAPVLLTPVSTNTAASSAHITQATPTFGLPLPEPTCLATPLWGLGDVWRNAEVRRRLGCPIGEQIGLVSEELYFQNGHMLWRPDRGLIYVLFEPAGQPGGWGAIADSLQPSDPDQDPSVVEPTPMPGPGGKLYGQPLGRFGKIWRENPPVRDQLGWALIPYENSQALRSKPFSGAVQDFEHGTLLWNGNVCFALYTDDMSWNLY